MILFAAGGVLLHYVADIEFAPLLGLFAGLLVANFIPARSGACKVKGTGTPEDTGDTPSPNE